MLETEPEFVLVVSSLDISGEEWNEWQQMFQGEHHVEAKCDGLSVYV